MDNLPLHKMLDTTEGRNADTLRRRIAWRVACTNWTPGKRAKSATILEVLRNDGLFASQIGPRRNKNGPIRVQGFDAFYGSPNLSIPSGLCRLIVRRPHRRPEYFRSWSKRPPSHLLQGGAPNGRDVRPDEVRNHNHAELSEIFSIEWCARLLYAKSPLIGNHYGYCKRISIRPCHVFFGF
jgi:hypothetical protein